MSGAARNHEPRVSAAGPAGIIDTIGLAFALLNRRPYLIWLPIVLDLVLWSGVRLSVADPAGQPFDWFSTDTGAFSSTAVQIRESLMGVELIALLTMPAPTLIGGLGRESVSTPMDAGSAVAASWADGALFVGAVLGAVVIGTSYLTIIGRLVSGRPASGKRFARDCIGVATRSIGLVFVVLALLLFLLFPFGVIAVAMSLIGVEPMVMLTLVSIILAVWLGLYFVFGLPALALGQDGITVALRSSYQVVQRNFLAVSGLLLIILVIRTGAPFALQVFTESEWSVPFAIVANAYVATGLITALMLFFHHRTPERSPELAFSSVDANGK